MLIEHIPAAVCQRPARPVPLGKVLRLRARMQDLFSASTVHASLRSPRRCVPDSRTHHSLLL